MIQEWIDKIAQGWIDRRMDQEVEKLKQQPGFEELKLHKANFDESGWSVDLIHENVGLFASAAAEMLQRQNAANYVQFILYPKLERDIQPVEVTVRWYHGGMTPAQKNTKLEADNKRYLERIEELTGQCNQFYRELEQAKAFHPRAWKLMQKGKPFVVVANDEVYYARVYSMIKTIEEYKHTWTEEDEARYQQAVQEWSEHVDFPTREEIPHD